ncbi:MAG: hypothetical protein M3Z26_07390 [Bacteroidota bacterium]|nr:hypothetical protein [Bacteroidota bacterium]
MKQFKIDSFDSVNNFLFEIYWRREKIFDPAGDLKNLKIKMVFLFSVNMNLII